MDVVVVTSSRGKVLTGNRCTARQWAELLRELGHNALVTDAYEGQAADVLVALHGAKSREAIVAFRERYPSGKVVAALTGTDVYPEPSDDTLDSVRRADLVVALQSRAREQVPREYHDKLRVIVQSAEAPAPGDEPESRDSFDVCVVGHLRAVKDPMRAAAAARRLPASSRVRIRHAGAILEPEFRDLVEREQAENPRYAWLGELAPAAAHRLIARSRLQVVSSFHEGGARVIGESVVAGTPVLAARNDASRSLLGDDYEGFFEAGDTAELAALLSRAETDADFLDRLRQRTAELAGQFDPQLEKAAWRDLMAELAELPASR